MYNRLLTIEEEKYYSYIIMHKDKDTKEYIEAFNDMFLYNVGLVIKIANDFKRNISIDMNDLVSEGYFGLIQAIKKYNPEKYKNVKFSTYASYWIEQSIRKFIDNNKLIRIPSDLNSKRRKYKDFIFSNRNATEKEIIENTGLNKNELNRIKNTEIEILSLYDKHGDSDNKYVGDYLEDKTSSNPLLNSINKEKINIVSKILDSFPNKERDIVTSYFSNDDINLQVLANKYNISRERVRQIKEETMLKIKRKLEKYNLNS